MSLAVLAEETGNNPRALLRVLRGLDKKARGLLLVKGPKGRNGKVKWLIRREILDDLRLKMVQDEQIAFLAGEIKQLELRVAALEHHKSTP